MIQKITGVVLLLLLVVAIILLLSYFTVFEPKEKKGKRLLDLYLPRTRRKKGKYVPEVLIICFFSLALIVVVVVFCGL